MVKGQGYEEQLDDDEGGGNDANKKSGKSAASGPKTPVVYPEKKILTRRQINRGLTDMEDLAPLKEMVGIQHISPVLYYIPCFKKKNIGFRQSLRFCFYHELGVPIPESE